VLHLQRARIVAQAALEEVHRGAAEESRHEQVRGLLVQAHRRVDLLDLAIVQHHDALAQRHGFVLVVRHVDHRRAEAMVEPRDFHPHRRAQFRVQIRQRFVEQEHLRFAHQCTAQRHALPLSAGKLARACLQQVFQTEHARRIRHTLFDFRTSVAAQFQPERQIPGHRHVRVQRVVLEHHCDVAFARRQVVDGATVDADGARGDVFQARDRAQQRGLAATRWPHQYQQFAVRDGEACARHGDLAVVVHLADVVEPNRRHAFPRSSRPSPSPGRQTGKPPGAEARYHADVSVYIDWIHTMADNPEASHAPFPAGFLWGCATSAYQIEGSPLADGAGASNWHRFVHTPGRVRDGDTGDVACDHYRRWREDIALMRTLGMRAYRFSIAWSRVLPEGCGRVNTEGLAFYDRLVDALLENGIQPMITLHHWDLPAALDDRGGWLNPDIAGWFADYARVMFRKLDDRVGLWTTINEPWVVSDGGYLHGVLAPGHRSPYEAPIAAHNLLRAHGAAVQAYRAEGRNNIGIVVNLEPKYPASQSAEDVAATRRADAYMNRQFLDPVFLGHYPEEMREVFGAAWPAWPDEDMAQIRQAIDFVGVNYYTRSVVRHDPRRWPQRVSGAPQKHATHTETGWEVYPQGLTDVLKWVNARY